MKFQRKRLARALASVVGVGGLVALAGTPAYAQTQPAPAVKERIEVTGTSIPRVEGEGALPVQTMTRQDIEKSGVQSVMEIIDRLSTAQSIGNFNNTLGEGTTAVGFNGVSLRGLGTQRSLVLIDGKRTAPYALSNTSSPSAAGVDLNAIPISAIERVEILKDGASALYGSDAIGGVINFILRKDFRGAEASFTLLDTEHGGGGSKRYNAIVGMGDLAKDKYNFFITADYLDQASLRASDREISHTAYLPQFGADRTSGNSLPANISQTLSDFAPNAPGKPFSGTHNPLNPQCLPPFSFPTVGSPSQCRFDFAATIDVIPPSQQSNVIGKATFQIAPDHQAFIEGSWYRGDFLQAISPTPVSSSFTINPTIMLPSNPFYPTAYVASLGGDPTQPIQLSYRGVETGPRADEAISEAYRAVAGLQGLVAGWDYQVAARYTQNKQTDNYVGGYLSETKFLPILATVVNPFGFNTPAVVAQMKSAFITGEASSNKAKDYGFDGRISKDIYELPAGPLSLALGGEWRKEELSLINADFLSSGDIIGGAGAIPSLTDSSRTVYAIFGEVVVPIVKTLEANFQVRWDHYSDVGSTTNPKISLRWQPTESFLMRGSYGTGFRAPALADLFQPPLRTNTNNNFDDPIRCPITGSIFDCNLQFNSLRGGNPNLKPEKSKQYNVGVVWQPVKPVSIGVDYFSVKITDVLTIIDADTIFGNFAQYQGQILRGPPTPDFPNLPGQITAVLESTVNAGKQEVSGWDVDLQYRQPTSWGNFKGQLTGTYLDHYKQTDIATGTLIEFVGQAAAPQGAVSRWRHYATFGWDYGPWNATVAQNFQLGYIENGGLDESGLRRVGSYEIYDLSGSYSGFKNVKLSAGIRNVFDRAPPASVGVGTFQFGYDPSYGDPRGRMYYGTIQIMFH
ncbi:MAG TPA: TonB-dependent receptor [Casimicrobiaceae bacterium]|jgi:iron complex outermembrane receptor protein